MKIHKIFEDIFGSIMVGIVFILGIFIVLTLYAFILTETTVCKEGIEYYKNFYKLSVKLGRDGKPIKCKE